jgi:hypothetical protein
MAGLRPYGHLNMMAFGIQLLESKGFLADRPAYQRNWNW